MNRLTIIFLFTYSFSLSQESRFSLELNYGLAANHFVTSYEENQIDGEQLLANKDFLGSVGEVQLNYFFTNGTSLIIGYARDNHQKERSYQNIINGVPIVVDKFSIRHNNNIFFLKHKRYINEQFKYHFGLFYLRPEQQEIEIWQPPLPPKILLEERDTPNNNLNEGGVLGGFDYEQKIDTKFTGGLHLSGYYLLSNGTYETTYLTGSLAYRFKKNK